MADRRKTLLVMLAILNVFLLSIGHAFNSKLIILVSLFGFFIVVIAVPKSMSLAILLFYLPWSPLMKFNTGDFSFYTLSFAFLFFIIIVKNEVFKRVGILRRENLLLICVFFVYTMLIKLLLGYSFSMGYLMFIILLIFIPSYINLYYRKISFEVCILFFSVGIITAGFSSNILMNLPHMLEYIKVAELASVGLIRLSGFYGDANFYSAHILVAISGLLIIISNKRFGSILPLSILVITLMYLGLLSVSKMFLMIIIVVLTLWISIVLMRKGKLATKITLVFIVIVAIFFIIGSGIFEKQIDMYLVRFGMISDVSSLTTGRSNILGTYLSFFKNNPMALFFGQGLTDVYRGQIAYAAHNTIIQIMYQFGIVGSALIVLWFLQLIALIRKNDKIQAIDWKRFNMNSATFAIACFGPWLALDILFADEFFYITALFLVGRRYMVFDSTA